MTSNETTHLINIYLETRIQKTEKTMIVIIFICCKGKLSVHPKRKLKFLLSGIGYSDQVIFNYKCNTRYDIHLGYQFS